MKLIDAEKRNPIIDTEGDTANVEYGRLEVAVDGDVSTAGGERSLKVSSYELHEVLHLILIEMKLMNIHLSTITGEIINPEEIGG